MTEHHSGSARHSQEAALAVVKASSQDPDVRADYRTIAESFEDDDYRQIIALAWRYQFSDDRYPFKRDLRELQQYVCSKVKLPNEEES